MTRHKVGVGLGVVAYALLLYTSLAAPAYARAHPHLDPVMLAQYAAPWPVALACAVAVAGIVLALVPLRRGERWSLWTSLAMLIHHVRHADRDRPRAAWSCWTHTSTVVTPS